MSTSIDQRVVQMQFDNRHFESNVSTTMSTLDKLKAKLNFKDSAKGLESLSTAAKKVDFSEAEYSATKAGFQIRDVWLKTATVFEYQVANKIVGAVKKMATVMTGLSAIKSGFKEYETQIDATQTIFSNVAHKGKTLADVNAALDELNEYADKTIYNFTEMTKNIGLFVNAGVGLDESVSAIKGFSNAAAMAGTNSTNTARAMYQLSQAMSSGTVRLMDWKSLETANITGERFQETIKMTARAHGIAIDDMIKKNGSLRETLKSGWLTAELMSEALDHYTLSTETMTEAEQEAAKVKLKSKGYTDEQIKSLFELGTEATNAATKVKSFTQLWEVLNEAAQSGWARTWRLIIGDLEEAKSFFTPLADFLTGITNKISDFRNRVLEIGLAFKEFWDPIAKKLGGVVDVVEKVNGALLDYEEVVNQIIRGDWGNAPTRWEDLAAAGYDWAHAQNLVNERLGCSVRHTTNYTEAQEEQGKATEAATVKLADLTDEQLRNAGLTEEEILLFHALKKEADRLGMSMEDLSKEMSETNGRDLLVKGFKNLGSVVVGVGKAIGKAYQEIFHPPGAEVLGIRLYGLLKSFSNFTEKLRLTDKETGNLNANGRKLARTFKGIFAVLDLVMTAVAGPIKLIFKVFSAILKHFNLNLLDVTALIGDVLVKVTDWVKGLFNLDWIIEKIVPFIERAAKAVKNWFKNLKDSGALQKFVGFLKDCWDALKNVFSAIAKSSVIQGFIDLVKKAADVVRDWFGAMDGESIFGAIGKKIKMVASFISKWVNGLKETDNVGEYLKNSLTKAFTVIRNALGNLLKSIGKSLPGIFSSMWQGVKNVFAWIKKLLLKIPGMDKVFAIISTCFDRIGGAASKFGGVISKVFRKIPGMAEWLDGLKNADNVALYILQGLVNGLKSGITKIWDVVKTIGKTIIDTICNILGIHSPSKVFFAIAAFCILGFADGFSETAGKFVGKCIESIKTIVQPVIDWLKELDWSKILTIAALAGAVWFLKQIGTLIGGLGSALGGIAGLCNGAEKALKGLRNFFNGMALKLIAEAVLELVAALVILCLIPTNKLWPAMAALAAIVVLLGVLSVTIAKAGAVSDGNTSPFAKMALMLFSLTGLLLTMTLIMHIISSMSWGDIGKASAVITGFFILIGLLSAFLMWMAGKGAPPMGIAVGGVCIQENELASAARMIQAMGIALIAMSVAAKIISTISWGGIGKVATLIGGFMLLIAGLMGMAAISGLWLDAAAAVISKVGTALLLMSLSVALLGWLSPQTIMQGTAVVSWFMTLLYGLVAMSEFASKEELKGVGNVIMGAGVAIIAMAAAVAIMGWIDEAALKQGMLVVGMFTVYIALLIALTNIAPKEKLDGLGKTLMSCAVLILAMAAAVAVLGLLKPAQFMQGMFAVTIFAIFIGVVIGLAKNLEKAKGAIIGLVALVAVLGGLVIAMSFIPFMDMLKSVGILVLIMTMMALFIHAVDGLKGSPKDAMFTMLGLAAVLAVVGATLVLLSSLSDDWYSAITAAASVSLVLLAMIGVLKSIDNMKSYKSNMFVLFGLATVVAAIGTTLVLLASLSKDQNAALEAGIALTMVLAALIGVLAIVKKMGDTSDAMTTLYALATVIAVIGLVLIALVKLPDDPNQVWSAAGGLTLVLLALVAVMHALTKMPKLDWSAIGKLTIMALVLALVGGVVLAASFIPTSGKTAQALIATIGALAALIGLMGLLGIMPNVDASAIGKLTIMALVLALVSAVVLAACFIPTNGNAVQALVLTIGALTALIGLMGLLAIMPNVDASAIGKLTIMALVLALVSAVVLAACFIPTNGNAVQALVLTIGALTALIGLMGLLGIMPNVDASAIGKLTIMALVLALVSAVVLAACFIPTNGNAVQALVLTIGALTALIGLMGLLAIMPNVDASAIGKLTIMALVLALVSAVVLAACFIPTNGNAVQALVLTIGALTALIGLMGLLAIMPEAPWSAIGKLTVMTLVIGLLGVVIAMLSQLPLTGGEGSIVGSLIAIAGALIILGIALNLMQGTITGAAALLVASIGLIALAAALQMMSGVDAVNTLIVLAVALAALAGALYLMVGGLPGAAALLVASIGLMALGVALQMMSGVDAANTLIVLVAALAALAGALYLMIGALPGAAALVVAAAGLVVLAAALVMLSAAGGGGDIVGMLTGLAVGLGLIAAVSMLLGPATPLLAGFGGALLVVAAAIAVFAAAVALIKGAGDTTSKEAGKIGKALPDGILGGITGGIGKVISAVSNFCKTVINKFKSVFGIHSPSKVTTQFGGHISQGFANGIKNGVGKVVDAVKNIGTKITEIASKWAGKFKEAAGNMVSGLANGLKNGIKSIGKKASELGSSAVKAFKKVLGIKSPSKVMAQMGKFFNMGFAEGIMSNKSLVDTASFDLGESAVSSFGDSIDSHQGEFDMGGLINDESLKIKGFEIEDDGLEKNKQIQEWLNKYYDAGLVVDGIIGPATKNVLAGLTDELGSWDADGNGIVDDELYYRLAIKDANEKAVDQNLQSKTLESITDNSTYKNAEGQYTNSLGGVYGDQDKYALASKTYLDSLGSIWTPEMAEQYAALPPEAKEAFGRKIQQGIYELYKDESFSEVSADEWGNLLVTQWKHLEPFNVGDRANDGLSMLLADAEAAAARYKELYDTLSQEFTDAKESLALYLDQFNKDFGTDFETTEALRAHLSTEMKQYDENSDAYKWYQDQINMFIEAENNVIAAQNAMNEASLNWTNWSNEVDRLTDLGNDYTQGFADGITENSEVAYDAGYEVGQRAQQGAIDAGDVHSPSRKMFEIGKYFVQGFANGIRENIGSAESDTTGLFGGIISKILNLTKDPDFSISPTITPIMDLSNVESGVTTIADWFEGTSVKLSVDAEALSASMNQNSQNGADLVVAAVNKGFKTLGTKIDAIEKPSYIIEELNVGDDQAVVSAFKTIGKWALRNGRA